MQNIQVYVSILFPLYLFCDTKFQIYNHVSKTITAAALLLLYYFDDSTNHKNRNLTSSLLDAFQH